MKFISLQILLLSTAVIVSSGLQAQWTTLGTGTDPLNTNSPNYIETICTDAAGTVYTAGRFTDVNDKQYVAKWNGTAWSELGTGANALNAGGYIYSVCADPSGNLYAGGRFTNSGGLFAYVAKWNGTSWSELGAGQNMGASYVQSVRSICTDASGNIYAAGEITDNTAAHYMVSKWDGTNWSLVGALNGNAIINAMAVDGSDIYVAGSFTNGAGHQYVAKWNGTTWAEIGTLNANGDINALSVDGSHNVYVGGTFTDAAGHNYVAKWNGTTWSELGGVTGIGYANSGGSIYAMTVDGSGNVYTGGGFEDANFTYYVAKWNGSSWSNFGNLAGDNFIHVLAAHGSNVYAGGAFENASSHPYVAENTNGASGIGELESNTCSMYPNPASSSFSLRFAKPISAEVTVTDMTGQQIATYTMNSESEKNFSANTFAAGIYLVKIATLSGDTRTMKLVKE